MKKQKILGKLLVFFVSLNDVNLAKIPLNRNRNVYALLTLLILNTPVQKAGVFYKRKNLKNQTVMVDFLENDISPDGLMSMADSYNVEAIAFAKEGMKVRYEGGDVIFKDKIIITPNFKKDYPCQANTILDVVFHSCSDFNLDFLNAFEASLTYFVNYNYKSLGDVAGETNSSLNCSEAPCNIDINFNSDLFPTITNIGLAQITIHENLHAMLNYLWHTGVINVNSNNPTYQELAVGYSEYMASNDPSNDGTSATISILEHEYILEFVNDAAEALKTYAQSQNINLSLERCVKLMWAGSLTVLPNYAQEYSQDERYEISAMINAEFNNQSYTYNLSNGTQNTVSPKGDNVAANAPCN